MGGILTSETARILDFEILIALEVVLTFLIFKDPLIVDTLSLGIARSRKIIDIGETWSYVVCGEFPAFLDVPSNFGEEIGCGITLLLGCIFDHLIDLCAVLRVLIQDSSVPTAQNAAHLIDAEGFFGHH